MNALGSSPIKRTVSYFCLLGLPLGYITIVGLGLYDKDTYEALTREDFPVQWLTFIFLVLAFIIALIIFIKLSKKNINFRWFFLIASIVFFFSALEEISYGQRVFGIQSPEFFENYSDQNETNIHNVFQKVAHSQLNLNRVQSHYFKTKTIAQQIALVYGIFLPILYSNGIGRKYFEKLCIVSPPLILVPGFTIAVVFLSDVPMRCEEEYGELYLSLCFCLHMWIEKINYADH